MFWYQKDQNIPAGFEERIRRPGRNQHRKETRLIRNLHLSETLYYQKELHTGNFRQLLPVRVRKLSTSLFHPGEKQKEGKSKIRRTSKNWEHS